MSFEMELESHKAVLGVEKYLAECATQLKRIADHLERFIPEAPSIPEASPGLEWSVTLWSIDRGVKVGSYSSDGPPQLGEMVAVSGAWATIVEVNIHEAGKLARARVRYLTEDERKKAGLEPDPR